MFNKNYNIKFISLKKFKYFSNNKNRHLLLLNYLLLLDKIININNLFLLTKPDNNNIKQLIY